MRICVVGAGAIGGLVAVRLARAGATVEVVIEGIGTLANPVVAAGEGA